MRGRTEPSRVPRLVALGLGATVACSTPPMQPTPPMNVAVGAGQTCGTLATTPSLVQATCDLNDGGAVNPDTPGCVQIDVTATTGLSLGLCTPTCGQGCTTGYDCVSVDGNVSGTVDICARKCARATDCTDPFQICINSHCVLETCASTSDCEAGLCSDGVCDPSMH
jgi:hypothetical protein